MVPLFVIVTAEATDKARPPAEPAVALVGVVLTTLPPAPPLPPLPTIKPLFTSSKPPGKLPLMVNPGEPVELDDRYTPALTVATTFDAWFHPAAIANVLKFPSV
jgi:hypothetical protein